MQFMERTILHVPNNFQAVEILYYFFEKNILDRRNMYLQQLKYVTICPCMCSKSQILEKFVTYLVLKS
jgi:hypothetical protein